MQVLTCTLFAIANFVKCSGLLKDIVQIEIKEHLKTEPRKADQSVSNSNSIFSPNVGKYGPEFFTQCRGGKGK